MNCKPGDLAVITKGENYGRFVMCLDVAYQRTWHVDRNLSWNNGKFSLPFCPDDFLRPIRDQPGTDEMIRIAGKPKANEWA